MQRRGAVAWMIATEAALAYGIVRAPWPLATAAAMGWAALSNLRGYRDEVSAERPRALLVTSAACVVAALLGVRSVGVAAVLVLAFIPIAGATRQWGIYARHRRIVREQREQLEVAAELRRQAELIEEANELHAAEAQLRERLGAARAAARELVTLGSVSREEVLTALDALRAELRAVSAAGRRAVTSEIGVAVAEGAPRPTTLATWAGDVRAQIASHREKTVTDLATGACFWLVMAAIGAWLPVVRETIALDPWLTLGVGVGGAPLMIAIERRALRVRSDAACVALHGASIAMMQVACAGLVACASPSGAVAYVAQYAAAIIGHGFHLRFTARTPWALGAYAVGLGAALGAARGDAQRGLVLATFAASLPLALVAGAKGRELDRLWMAMREARAAWMVERAASERGRIRRLTEGLRGLIGGAHDASSSFFVARLAAERLDEGEGGHADAAAGVHRSMRTVVERLEKTLAVPAVALADPVAVAVSPIVEALARGAHRGITVETALEPCAAEVYEGADTLKRIAANVLCNAVEAARGRVRISCGPSAPDRIELVVEDDGPGFVDGFRVRAFETGKAGGVGLGLFVVERLASLSRGELTLGRSEQLGGARVAVRLPRAAASSASPR